jgi:hypothetical protein
MVATGRSSSLSRPHSKEALVSLTVRSLLLLAAVVLFVLAALGIDLGAIALVPLGLACFAGSFVAPNTVVGTRR